ncbi:GNAT family N-acetyltransferase [Aestuariibaculum suncheonense]|uniref:GNAT family N-acetyltransferase n=1 Tax=Aestuariibaculum suncheonense TaxID=1028745 RepID=A0A8J6UCP6_9FLAO|nr:GNAT family N-acetyltransferase [Aestuariibaculum suncheonense]MBD0836477.1 GNAT family N-acetyltransferase [Aestuariibaculum suncheonense]
MNFEKCFEVESFFSILPLDWQESILPFWDDYKASTECFVLKEEDDIIAGGLVFSECPPDMLYAKQQADFWFDTGYKYLGFIYVLESKRGQNLGSLWLNSLKDTYMHGKFWLTIEDINLHHFYVKNGFRYVKTLDHGEQEEGLYIYPN